ncbi:MAG: hypothetical protein DMF84_28700 [Acidobacteria bacterium]|nr:MAG: hypothetical protein DMF84_28700 [Acidobacteriota bacterium]
MVDPADPRWPYPYINCTDCGPRFSIVWSRPSPGSRARSRSRDRRPCGSSTSRAARRGIRPSFRAHSLERTSTGARRSPP